MRQGEFDRAWRHSDIMLRRHLAAPPAATDVPRHQQVIWNGASLHGKRVLVRCYHGLGDTIQFIRYIPLLKTIAAQVTVWAQPSLISLLSTTCEIDSMIPLHEGRPDCDYDVDVEVMELPYVFRTTLETIPARVPYFHVDAFALNDCKMRVGLVWRGGDWDPRRDVPFDVLTQLTELQEISFYALQQEPPAFEHHESLKKILPSGADALTTARVIRALDLVVSIDSMPAHLAGALGVRTWTLLQKNADWRWMCGRDDNPWYPTMRLFRQQQPGDWQPVVAQVKRELRQLLLSRKLHRSCL